MKTPPLIVLCRLLRIPNVFSAFADVLMGYWLLGGGATEAVSLTFLLGCSGSLYLAGMVFNDVFDVEVDRIERPQRPLPSGAIGMPLARTLGTGLVVAGLGCAVGAGQAASIFAVLLTCMIFAYDGCLKKTPLGPAAMGACRSLNVLLGMSTGLAANSDSVLVWGIPLANGLYIVGVTWFARQEAQVSRRPILFAAANVMCAGLATHVITLILFGSVHVLFWVAAPVALCWWGQTVVKALKTPDPAHVQAAVKTSIFGLVVIDGLVTVAVVGPMHGLFVLALLAPSFLLGRWVYST